MHCVALLPHCPFILKPFIRSIALNTDYNIRTHSNTFLTSFLCATDRNKDPLHVWVTVTVYPVQLELMLLFMFLLSHHIVLVIFSGKTLRHFLESLALIIFDHS